MRHIALAGKGSTGKTTILPFLIDHLLRTRAPGARLLVVDADPQMSATRLLGVDVGPHGEYTLGHMRSRYETEFLTGAGVPQDETRTEFAERKMADEGILRLPDYDFVAMGRWDLKGSQCTVNRLLGYALAQHGKRYDAVILDNEAGLEHVGRYHDVPLDTLLVVATPNPEFLAVAERIWDYCGVVRRPVAHPELVLNFTSPRQLASPLLQERLRSLEARGVRFAGALPHSEALRDLSYSGRPLLDLDLADPWRQALDGILNELFPVALPATAERIGAHC